MEIEAALPPPSIRLNYNIRKYALRVRKLPRNHPIQENYQGVHHTTKGLQRQLERIYNSIQSIIVNPEEEIKSNHFRP
jgi:hypothetical protein